MKYFVIVIVIVIIILFIILHCMGCVNVNVNKEINTYVIEPVVELEIVK